MAKKKSPLLTKESTEAWLEKKLPSMTLMNDEGKPVKLPEDLEGTWTVLYFYPKDSTPGCTVQACEYRDNISRFKKIGARVYGISMDSVHSHQKFIQKHKLNFPLLVDEDRKLCEKLGVYGEKKFMGRTFQGIRRQTFLIDPKGVIREVWRKVSPDTTVDETYEALKRLLG